MTDNEIIYSTLNVELRMDNIPCLINIPLPITYEELSSIYTQFNIDSQNMYIANIQYSNDDSGKYIYNSYIKNGKILTSIEELEIICAIRELTGCGLLECIEIYVNKEYKVFTIEEYEKYLTSITTESTLVTTTRYVMPKHLMFNDLIIFKL